MNNEVFKLGSLSVTGTALAVGLVGLVLGAMMAK